MDSKTIDFALLVANRVGAQERGTWNCDNYEWDGTKIENILKEKRVQQSHRENLHAGGRLSGANTTIDTRDTFEHPSFNLEDYEILQNLYMKYSKSSQSDSQARTQACTPWGESFQGAGVKTHTLHVHIT